MTVDQIYGQIRYYENLIDQYNNQKRTLETEIAELETLRGKYSSLQTKLGQKQQARQTNLSSFLASALQNNILKKYYEGMNGLLTGADFNNAYSGLDEAKTKIIQKANQLDQQVDQCNANISSCMNSRAYWMNQLSAALAAEEAE